MPLLELLDEDFTEELLLDDERSDDELRTVEVVTEEVVELVLVPVALNAAIVGVPEPFAQNPTLTELLAAIDLFHAKGVTTLPDRLPFHRLLIWAPAVFRVIVQPVTGVFPALISTCAQYPEPQLLLMLRVASALPEVIAFTAGMVVINA